MSANAGIIVHITLANLDDDITEEKVTELLYSELDKISDAEPSKFVSCNIESIKIYD